MQSAALLFGKPLRPFRALEALGPAAIVLTLRATVIAGRPFLRRPALPPGPGMGRALYNRESNHQRQPELHALSSRQSHPLPAKAGMAVAIVAVGNRRAAPA